MTSQISQMKKIIEENEILISNIKKNLLELEQSDLSGNELADLLLAKIIELKEKSALLMEIQPQLMEKNNLLMTKDEQIAGLQHEIDNNLIPRMKENLLEPEQRDLSGNELADLLVAKIVRLKEKSVLREDIQIHLMKKNDALEIKDKIIAKLRAEIYDLTQKICHLKLDTFSSINDEFVVISE